LCKLVEETAHGLLHRVGPPEAESRFGMPEDKLSVGHSQAKVDSEKHLRDLDGGSAQAIQSSAPARGKASATRLTAELLYPLRSAFPIGDEGMEGGIGIAAVIIVGLRAGVAGGANSFGLPRRLLRSLQGRTPNWVYQTPNGHPAGDTWTFCAHGCKLTETKPTGRHDAAGSRFVVSTSHPSFHRNTTPAKAGLCLLREVSHE
jgi:hypothetical protein